MGAAMSEDRRFMWRALELARRGRAFVAPNPMCGAVLVKDGRVIGEGYHTAFGEAHAEVNALKQAGPAARGSTLYLTLEPCFQSYEGKKTPPCAPRLIEAGISRAFIAVPDPHIHVAGKGAKALMQAGVKVMFGLCEEEARELNAAYFSLIERKRPAHGRRQMDQFRRVARRGPRRSRLHRRYHCRHRHGAGR
jgi:diaminohydroxyphosphoribosylaminopyrimidine deaminase/5-amino-6-(5-phosphoribosylamino)uracil reductase